MPEKLRNHAEKATTLFFYQAEKETGITLAVIELAIKKHVAKIAALDVQKSEKAED